MTQPLTDQNVSVDPDWGKVHARRIAALEAELAMVRENEARMQDAGDRLMVENERLRNALHAAAHGYGVAIEDCAKCKRAALDQEQAS